MGCVMVSSAQMNGAAGRSKIKKKEISILRFWVILRQETVDVQVRSFLCAATILLA